MDGVYRQFEAFDFENDDFKNGLENLFQSYLDQLNQDKDSRIHEIVTDIPSEDKERLAIQAKTFYFCKETGNIMNIEDYQEWKLRTITKEDEISEPQYSSNYNEIVELILAGKEKDIPGIKIISDTVLEGQSSENPVLTRKKPWEIAASSGENETAETEEEKESTSDVSE